MAKRVESKAHFRSLLGTLQQHIPNQSLNDDGMTNILGGVELQELQGFGIETLCFECWLDGGGDQRVSPSSRYMAPR